MSTSSILLRVCVSLAVLVPLPMSAQDVDPEAVVNAFNAFFGKHPGTRASGAKGICVKGTFSPSAEAQGLSKAPQFAGPVPVIGRFSMGGGNPKASDKTKASTRGFALRFATSQGDTDLVMISAPIFGARTPQQLLEGLQARMPG